MMRVCMICDPDIGREWYLISIIQSACWDRFGAGQIPGSDQ